MHGRCRGHGQGGARYAALGITVCHRWSDFVAFLQDMGECPTAKHTLDRIDNSKGYEPSNCRWATMKEQQNNRTNNVRITYQGETLTVSGWAEKLGLNRITLYKRFHKDLPIEQIFERKKMVGHWRKSSEERREARLASQAKWREKQREHKKNA
jgi:hypothetical protein